MKYIFRYKCFLYLLWLVCGLSYNPSLGYGQHFTVNRETLGKINDSRLNELSGLQPSHSYSNMFWCHNDSGDTSQIFLIDDKAKLQGVYLLQGIQTKDTEDITSFRRGGKSYLILADIGDNRAVRNEIVLYIFQEPEWFKGKLEYVIPKKAIQTFRIKYVDRPRDAEALFVDPQDGRCYIIAKRDFHVGIYPVDIAEAASGQTQVIRSVSTLPLTFVTSADISRNGDAILIKNLTNIFLWQRQNNESIVEVLSKPFNSLPYEVEPQGEAICFGSENSYFYTISERPLGLDSYLYRYNIMSPNK